MTRRALCRAPRAERQRPPRRLRFDGRPPALLALVPALFALTEVHAGGPCAPDFCDGDRCVFEGITNRPLGQARLTLSKTCDLQIDGIGSSGGDGFRQSDFPEAAEHIRTGFTGLRFPDNGFAARIQYFGPTTTAGEALITNVTVSNESGTAVIVDSDTTPVGNLSNVVRIFSRGALVQQVAGLQKGTTVLPASAAIIGVQLQVGERIVFTYHLGGTFPVTVPDNETVQGDTVQVIALAPQVTVPLVTIVDTTAANVGPVLVTIEVGGPPMGTICVDFDGDGFGLPGDPTCPRGPAPDCDDNNRAVFPGAPETCNGGDDDCDGGVDEDFDLDRDGFTTCNGDCDDSNPAVNPKKKELCDGIDNDCDDSVDEGFDADRDGFTSCGGDCNDNDPAVNPDKAEICNRIDDDCDESVDEGFDQDRDGFTTCAGDCDDTDPGANPEKDEVCTGGADEDCDGLIDERDPDCAGVKETCDGRDNDGDGDIDEGFTLVGLDQNPQSPTYGTVQDLPLGATCVAGDGECEAVGTVECSPNGQAATCNADTTPPGTEGPPGDPTCFDFRDNDCDGGTDHNDRDCASEERCDGFDNDADGQIDEAFPTLGDACVAGTGVCEKQGVIVCSLSGAGVECTAGPGGTPGTESPPGSRFCTDARDNDCDGAVDLADSDCQEQERCDGRDNDNDGLVDEDFPNLGEPCETGEGHCRAEGVLVCAPDGSGVRCDAKPFGARPEGPAGCTCFDGVDNDCNGAVDAQDLNCRSARIADTIRCELQSRRGINDRCSGLYQVGFSSTNPDAILTGRLMALDADGNLIDAVEAADGDIAFLQSRNTPPPGSLGAAGTISLGRRPVHWIFAHNPVLEVTADDGLNRGRAYCSVLPYLDVVEPDNSVVSLSEGDETPVTVAIPNMDPASLQIKVDGVDVVAALGLDPGRDFPGGPYRGSFVVTNHALEDRRVVEVCDLVVRSDIGGKTSGNTLTMTLRNMGCGGHVIAVGGSPAPRSLPGDPVETCHLDDGRDVGVSNSLGVQVDSPDDGQIVFADAFTVQGVACHGLPFGRLRVAGSDQSITGEILVPGDGEDTADTWVLPFASRVDVADLRNELDTGVAIPGQVDPGANRLIVQASDVEFNTTFDNVFFAVSPNAGAAAGGDGGTALDPVDNAFTLALDGPGMTTFVSSLCEEIKPLLEEKVEGALIGRSTPPRSFPVCDDGDNKGDECESDDDCPDGECKGQPFPLCDLENVILQITDADLDLSGFQCSLIPQQDKISFGITTPAFTAAAHVSGGCEDRFLGICTVRVTLDSDAELSFDNFDVGFEITEAGILNQEFISEPTFDFGDDPDLIEGSFETPDIGCIVGFFKFLLEVVFFIIKILSFGLIDISFDEIEFEISSDDLKERIAERGGDFGEVNEFRFDNERLDDFNLDLSNLLSDVQISPAGIAAGIRASFTAIEEDPDVADTVEVELTPAPLPLPPIAGADEVTVAISDDVFNTLLGGLAKGGVLKTLFEDRRELGDFLPDPADCSTLGPVREPRCVGINGGDCSQFFSQVQRNRCEDAKERFESRNLRRNTVIILHGRADNPPKLLIDDDPKTSPVEVHFRYSQLSIGIFADRDGDGALQGASGSIPACFGNNASTTTECALWEACLNLNVPASVEIPLDRLSLIFQILDFEHDLSTGTLCGGGIEDEDDDLILESAQGDTLDRLNERLREGVPELSSMGLNFGGLVEFQNPRLIAIENDGNPDFQDYIAITGRLIVPE